MKKIITICLIAAAVLSCKDTKEKTVVNDTTVDQVKEMAMDTDVGIENLKIHPISHATMVLEWDNTVIYIDPVGGKEAFADEPAPDLILVTDIHGDHLNVETIAAIISEKSHIVAPQAVFDKLPEPLKLKATILNNDEKHDVLRFTIEAIPMYNLRKEALKFHAKGRGNGYVINKNNKRVYISGDTEDIPEMRALQNIDIAFVCMNLPYTMTVESAADAVLEFAPKKVYPYHYRGTEGLSNIAKFNTLILDGNSKIKVEQLDWYPVN